jgi:hypothetical protein
MCGDRIEFEREYADVPLISPWPGPWKTGPLVCLVRICTW